jgi:hypothetical protein
VSQNEPQRRAAPITPTGTDVVIGGAIATLVVWVLALFGIDTPPTVAAAITTLTGWIIGTFLYQRKKENAL